MTLVTGTWLTAPATQKVLGLLTAAGHRALAVGGCVRNALLDAAITDVDISTSAHPDEVTKLAESAGLKAIPTGIEHGTVTVVCQGKAFEITTFRKDVETDGRRAVVAFSDDIRDDAMRRDFTLNALFCEADGTLVDPLGGLPDLLARRIVFVGDPGARIREDYLRILRFFRFYAWYGDTSGGIDADGLAACAELADGIDGLSRERAGAELLKLLGAPDPAPALASMEASGILWRILPGASSAVVTRLVHFEGQSGHAPDPLRRLAALGGQITPEDLRLSKQQARRFETLRDVAVASETAEVIGYRHGAEMGEDTVLLRSALFESPLDPSDLAAARRGANAQFPIKAADLTPAFEGKALGDELKRLEAKWIASGFQLTARDLLP